MNCIYEHKDKLYINNNLYNNEKNIKALFNKTSVKKDYKIINYSSSDDEDFNLNNNITYSTILEDSYDEDFDNTNEYTSEYTTNGEYTTIVKYTTNGESTNRGGVLLEKSSKKSKIFNKIKYMKIMPSFINVVKGKILYNKKSKFTIEPIIPSDHKNVILGILIDLIKIDDNIENISLDKIEKYIKSYDVVPLLYNDSRNIVYKNKKTYFFSKPSKLAFITFKMPANYKYYIENIDLTPLSKLHEIDTNKLTENSLIAHFIYENYYFLHTHPQKLKIHNCYIINIDENYEFIELEKAKNMIPNGRKLSIDEIYTILKKCKNMLKF
jgi:hypothetical protein